MTAFDDVVARVGQVDVVLVLRNTAATSAAGRVRLTISTSQGQRVLPWLQLFAPSTPTAAPDPPSLTANPTPDPAIGAGQEWAETVVLRALHPGTIGLDAVTLESDPPGALELLRAHLELPDDPALYNVVDSDTPLTTWGGG